MKWKTKIVKACEAAGTYREYFNPIIDTLAGILEKNGATNLEQNPLIRLINDLNRDALTYWKELGLTAASLKKINEAAIKGSSELSVLDKALLEFGG